ncbi:hypothetical protein [Mucilaginibacter sp. OK268]|uniref:hypothetical protein n=1 Tax=Mucilaginibacter sp. OK268 TaxID=1881048 RepID=UPI000B879151|nr:hypothetical protein [Mucilaginibacter sp. OK268]
MEITITMLLAAIVISITYTAYTIISKSYLGFTNKNKEMTEAVQLDKLLKNDFYKASLISRDNQKILFRIDSTDIRYEFAPDRVTRTQGITDTFKIQTETMSTSFDHQPLQDDPQATDRPGLLDEMEWKIILQNQKIPYHYHKPYSSVNLFQENPDANH